MRNPTVADTSITIGLDVGDRTTHYCVLNAKRRVVARGTFATLLSGVRKSLGALPRGQVVLEAGSQSPWLSRELRRLGFAVQVADPRRVQLISRDPRKTDRRDAHTLAVLGAGVPELLGRIHHRGVQAQADLSGLRTRDLLVRMRTMAVQQVRGLAKAFGVRLPSASTAAFPKRVADCIPEELRPAVQPVLETIGELSTRIRELERQMERIARERYPETAMLREVNGVGALTSLAFVLSIEDPHRFEDSRRVGSWLGLCPRSHASGDCNPQLRISKAGDVFVRRLLVQSAHYILGPFGRDSNLRRFGNRLALRGGRAAKKRAAVAVARKLAILLHRLWVTGTPYDPLHQSRQPAPQVA